MDSKPVIEIEGLTKIFSGETREVKALENINLTINRGDIFGIIGMSGAGKSTLVRCINYLEKPTSGRVAVDGVDLASLNEKELRKVRQSMGMIFQQFNLLMQRTAIENITFPLEISGIDKKDALKRAKELLNLVDLADKAEAYPSQLSGGQKQRVAIARALSTNPKVLLCDEATSALDPNTTKSILSLLKDINSRLGITIVIITHEMSVVEQICSHVAIIDKSGIAEQGKVSEVFSHPKTPAAQRLVYPNGNKNERKIGSRCLRIVFDGSSSYEPVIARMILDCGAPVNIMFADMRDIEGKAFGQMVIQLPEDPLTSEKIINYLKERNLAVEEVFDHVG
ncbi:methionine ABC transporter ATP-binding protein [Ruminiclostridium josui]|uniref:methionine ABC transporter ATP-binding protein n=1 Tax=Ruminiclostridium josui TaxID=1499 RepID=UPI0004631972|nr:ATP-binding cassette domain-containing protein [Ruminiclostridium josui]